MFKLNKIHSSLISLTFGPLTHVRIVPRLKPQGIESSACTSSSFARMFVFVFNFSLAKSTGMWRRVDEVSVLARCDAYVPHILWCSSNIFYKLPCSNSLVQETDSCLTAARLHLPSARGLAVEKLRMNHAECVCESIYELVGSRQLISPLASTLLHTLRWIQKNEEEGCTTSFVFHKITKSIKLLARNLNINPSYAMWHTYTHTHTQIHRQTEREARTSCKWWGVGVGGVCVLG